MTMARLWTMVAAGLAFALPGQAQEPAKPRAQPVPRAATDPLTPIYRVPGVFDNGQTENTGVATTFLCTSYSAMAEKIRFVIRQYSGTVRADLTYDLPARVTLTISTHKTATYSEDGDLATGTVNGGSATISATTTNVHCSAMTLDAQNFPPPFAVSLHMVRVNPVSGIEE